MKILVFYEVDSFDEIDECHYFDDKYIIVNVPEDLLLSEIKGYVYEKYYNIIFDIEKNSCGSLLLYHVTINNCFILMN